MHLRILAVSHAASAHTTRPVDLLLRQGHEVALLSTENPWPGGRPGFTHIPHGGGFTALPALLQAVGKKFGPHIVHVHYAWLPVYYCVKADIAPVVVSVWGSDINDFVRPARHGYAWRPFMPRRDDLRTALPKVARVIIDDATMFDKCRFIAPDCAPMELLPLGVDTGLFRPATTKERLSAREALGLTPENIVLFSPRAMTSFYNQHAILQAFAKVAPSHPRARLLLKKFIPDSNPAARAYADQLERTAMALPCAHQIRFVPAVPPEKLPMLYWASDAIINFPREDGFPVTLAEAAATCTPILTARQPAYAGTFAERHAFKTFSGKAALSQALMEFFRSPAIPQEQALSAREEVLEKYSTAHYDTRLLTILREVTTLSEEKAAPDKDWHKSLTTGTYGHQTGELLIKKRFIKLIKNIVPQRIKIWCQLFFARRDFTHE